MSGGDWVDLTEAITGLVERNGWAPAPVIEVPAKSDVRERSEEPQAPAIDGLAIPYRTPLEVATTTPGRTAWIVRGYAALQGITEVDGKVKSAGKTTFLLALTGAALDGSPFLGQPVTACKVVYVTEQAPGPFREALERAGLMGRGDELRIVFRRDVAHIPWRELVATITADAIRDGYAVVIWDTIAKLAGIRGRERRRPDGSGDGAAPGFGARRPVRDRGPPRPEERR